MRVANRLNEPTPAPPAVPAPEGTDSVMPESIAPGSSAPPDHNSGEVYGPYGDAFGDCGQCGTLRRRRLQSMLRASAAIGSPAWN